MSRGRFRISTLRCPEVGLGIPDLTSGHLDERMGRRSSRNKGGVTRGREEQPQGNSTMKRGSPTTVKVGSKVIQAHGQFTFNMLVTHDSESLLLSNSTYNI